MFRKDDVPGGSGSHSRREAIDSLHNSDVSATLTGVYRHRAGWSDRRLVIRSALHKGDWKLATGLYLIVVGFVLLAAYLQS